MDDVFQIVSRRQDMEGVRRRFFRMVKNVTAFHRCALYLLNEEDMFQLQEKDPPESYGFEWIHHLIEDGIIDWLIREEKVRPIPCPRDPRGDRERLIVPLIVRGTGFGFLAVEGPLRTDPQRDENSIFLSTLGLWWA